ncbi:MAG TPA: hypothetical protein VFM38_15020 [Candidatus Limnocylindrales bacterium]|nr:hypothetical protein [Candidatus Limnocylindrales bacterium]
MYSFYAMLALDLANDRAREARELRLAQLARESRTEQPSVVRRGLARATAAVSLGAASMTRRLDECVADDLGRTLAAAD